MTGQQKVWRREGRGYRENLVWDKRRGHDSSELGSVTSSVLLITWKKSKSLMSLGCSLLGGGIPSQFLPAF